MKNKKVAEFLISFSAVFGASFLVAGLALGTNAVRSPTFVATTSMTAPAFISSTGNPVATAGAVRLAKDDAIDWRNNANGANIPLAKDTSDNLTYNSVAFLSSTPRILAAAMPALTGDVTTSAGAVATTLATTIANAHTFSSQINFSRSSGDAIELTGGGGIRAMGVGTGAPGSFISEIDSTAANAVTDQTIIVATDGNVDGASSGTSTRWRWSHAANAFTTTMSWAGTDASGTTTGDAVNIVAKTSGARVGINMTPSNDLDVTGTFGVTGLATLSGGLKGTTTNDNATALNVGEAVRSAVASGSAVSLSTLTSANVTSISLTAGDWDVSTILGFTGTPTGTQVGGGPSSTSATLGTQGDNATFTPTMPNGNSDIQTVVPSFRFSLSGTTTIFLVARATFTGGSVSAYGRISARRVR